MGRNGVSVYKYTMKGKLVRRYATVEEAIQCENTNRYYLRRAMEEGRPLNEHVFTFGARPSGKKKEVNSRRKSSLPWGKDGMFDIDGWAKVCL